MLLFSMRANLFDPRNTFGTYSILHLSTSNLYNFIKPLPTSVQTDMKAAYYHLLPNPQA